MDLKNQVCNQAVYLNRKYEFRKKGLFGMDSYLYFRGVKRIRVIL